MSSAVHLYIYELCSFANLSVTSPTSELIVPTLPSFYLRHSSFSNISVTSPTSQLIFPTLPSFYLRHSPFSNPSVASPKSQFILQPFFRFSYVTSSSLNSPGEPPMGLSPDKSSFLCVPWCTQPLQDAMCTKGYKEMKTIATPPSNRLGSNSRHSTRSQAPCRLSYRALFF